ncbi:hypothetical protein GUITHDRAFT_118731 [Guillardia theta CCMP2712]|uniref:Uncharacterized protein n=1 Tax=Guillardia theta (strain CCMP2712) TaxID=905079 RepID=L1IGW6_GUITC|nr:hypothetical protein GUITHDRAFT_118731 [Guillardia theta CCMP2712]EKX35075.1 hypothetical protein GUITHDRAFT_118731 [Guillardia theta CCMP2712]|eukprot:XP_005822055.1 hypothetical protein GUITHDRAFT_118731 [Guillardia theta CCMP2712]
MGRGESSEIALDLDAWGSARRARPASLVQLDLYALDQDDVEEDDGEEEAEEEGERGEREDGDMDDEADLESWDPTEDQLVVDFKAYAIGDNEGGELGVGRAGGGEAATKMQVMTSSSLYGGSPLAQSNQQLPRVAACGDAFSVFQSLAGELFSVGLANGGRLGLGHLEVHALGKSSTPHSSEGQGPSHAGAPP